MIALSLAIAMVSTMAPEPDAGWWDAPAGCPGPAELERRIEQQRLALAVEPVEAGLRARVTAPEGPAGGWRLTLELDDGGSRHLEADSCDALADAVALMVVVGMVETTGSSRVPGPSRVPEPTAEDPSPSPSPSPARPAPVAVSAPTSAPVAAPSTPLHASDAGIGASPAIEASASPRAPDARAPDRRPRGPTQAVLGLSGGLHGPGLPRVGGGIGGYAGVRRGPLRIVASGLHWFRRERPVVDQVAAAYRLTTGGLELCGVPTLGGRRVVELPVCAYGEAGRVRGDGVGATPSRMQRHGWLAVGGAVGIAWVVRPGLAVSAHAQLVAPLLRRAFVIGTVSAGDIGPIDARGQLALEVRLPEISAAR